MKLLITPAEVMKIAFGTTHTLHDEAIPAHTILAAQRRLIRPIVGAELYDQLALSDEAWPEHIASFVGDYLKTPLALYVASLLLPTIAAQVGSMGVVRLSGSGMEPVEKQTLRRVCRRLRADANALMDVATDYLAEHRDLFPLYNPNDDVRQRVNMAGSLLIV
ncbi:MAG: hypothetical protein J6R10_06845 [Tidjanibacter sp.]|nr:hypothetical protein [Tidjanibacter sp.]